MALPVNISLWQTLYRPLDCGVDLPFRDQASETIKQYYQQHNKGELVLWKDETNDSLGVIRINRSIVIPFACIQCLELQMMRPAKGPGYAALAFKTTDKQEYLILSSDHYSDKACQWLLKTQAHIADLTGVNTEQCDHGYDA